MNIHAIHISLLKVGDSVLNIGRVSIIDEYKNGYRIKFENSVIDGDETVLFFRRNVLIRIVKL
jgi:hypothetical protein